MTGATSATSSEDRVALITGGAGGVGRATAERLLRNGWRVALCDVNAERLAEVLRQLAVGERLLTITADVRTAAEWA